MSAAGQVASRLAARLATRIAAVLLLAASAAPGYAATALQTADEIEACVRANLPRQSSVQSVVFRSTSRLGDVTESRARLHWKLFDEDLSKVMLRFSRPIDLRGAGVLLIEQQARRPDVFMYLPELRKVRRVSSRAASSSLFGTDFSYEDFERVLGMSADAKRSRLADQAKEGRAVYVVEGRPGPDSGSGYERVVSYVDQATCVPLRTESYEPGGALRKVLTVDADRMIRSVAAERSVWIPLSQTIRDLRDETGTELIVEEIELEATIARKMFSTRELEAGAR